MFSSLGTQIQGAIAGVTIGAVGSAISSLNEMGTEIEYTGKRFVALVGGAAQAEQAMADLREVTGGVVADSELARQAVGMMMTGVAKDAQQAGRLMALGLQLGGSEGLEKLNQALKNQSYLVLDSVGISASEVRELATQYRDAGMESSAAFNQAVLDVGEKTRDQLGDAARAGETSLARVGVWMNNLRDDLGQVTAAAVEAGAQLLEIIAMRQQLIIMSNPDPNQPAALGHSAFEYVVAQLSGRELEPTQAYLDYIAERRSRQLATFNQSMYGGGGAGFRFPEPEPGQFEPGAVFDSLRSSEFERYLELMEDLRRGDGMHLLSQDEIQAGLTYADTVQRMYDDMQAAAEAGAPIQDADLQLAQGYADSAKAMSDEFHQMSLSAEAARQSLAGIFKLRGGGGLGAELGGIVVDAAKEAGMTDEQIAAIQQMNDLSNGVTNPAYEQLQGPVARMLADIAAQYPEDYPRVFEAVQGAAMRGYDTGQNPQDVLDMIMQVIPFQYAEGGGGGQHTVAPNESMWAIAQANDMTLEELLAYNPEIADRPRMMIHPGEEVNLGAGLVPTQSGYGGRSDVTAPNAVINIANAVITTDGSGPLQVPPVLGPGGMGPAYYMRTPTGGYDEYVAGLEKSRFSVYDSAYMMYGPGDKTPRIGGDQAQEAARDEIIRAGLIGELSGGVSGIDTAAQGVAGAFSGAADSLESMNNYVDPLSESTQIWEGSSRNLADHLRKSRDMVKEIAGMHDVTLSFTATVGRDMPPWFLDMLERGLVIIASRHGGTLPGTSTAGKGG